MITIIHGNDIISSRRRFIEEKQKNKDSLLFDGGKVTFTELIQHAEGSLFGGDKKLFIENLLTRKKSKELDEIVSYLQAVTLDVFLWEGDDQGKKVSTFFPKATIVPFKLTQTLFSFLDSIRPGEGKKLVSLFHDTLKTTEAELIFFMLVRQFRLLLALSDTVSKLRIIDEATRLAPWQREKLKRQAQLFTFDRLREIYKRLYQIDLDQKTGNTSLSLVQNIDIFLLDL